MHIELFGLPGCGKSTVRKHLLQELQSRGSHQYFSTEEAFYRASLANIDNIYKRLLLFLPTNIGQRVSTKLVNRTYMQHNAQSQFLAKHGGALSAYLNSSNFDNMQTRDRSLVIGNFLEVGSLRECIKPIFEDAAVIFDEGFIQKSLMFIDHLDNTQADPSDISRYLEAIPKPDLSIYIEVDIEDCHRRMLSRQDGLTTRLKNADSGQISSFLYRINNHFEDISQWLNNRGHPVIRIDNNSNLMDTVTSAFDAIENSFLN